MANETTPKPKAKHQSKPRRNTRSLAATKQQVVTTRDQQMHLRANAMRSASVVLNQIHSYVESGGNLTVAGQPVDVTPSMVSVWKLCLAKALPDLTSTEITSKTEIESMSSEQLMTKLQAMIQESPVLRERFGGMFARPLLEGTAKTARAGEEEGE